MSLSSEKTFSDLYATIISKEGMCSGCGACVLICPYKRLSYIDSKPQQMDEKKDTCPINEMGKCAMCVTVCPRLNRDPASMNFDSISPVMSEQHVSFLMDTKNNMNFQDGGAVSGLLLAALQNGNIGGALTYSRDGDWQIFPNIAKNSEDVLRSSGSKYTYISIIDGLKVLYETEKNKNQKYAIVGLPCHIEAVRNLMEVKSKYTKNISLCIGLFCTKAFSYERLIENKLKKEMGLNIENIQKMDIRNGEFSIIMNDGKNYNIPLKELQSEGHIGCAGCTDFTAENADISCGGLGIENRTVVQCRTEIGKEIFELAVNQGYLADEHIEVYPEINPLIEKLTKFKRKRAKNLAEKFA